MTRSQLQSAVIQSIILIALEMIISHEISRNAYNNVWEDPVLKNLTTAYKNIPQNATLSSGSEDPWVENPESFYFLRLPRGVLIYALLFPLSYYWHIYLERLFPTRPRGRQVNYEKKEKVEVELNADQEEEVVKRVCKLPKTCIFWVAWTDSGAYRKLGSSKIPPSSRIFNDSAMLTRNL